MSIIGTPVSLGHIGHYASIEVTANTGSTVTCTTPSGIILTTTEVSGKWLFDKLDRYGNYIISTSSGNTETILVSMVQQYSVDLQDVPSVYTKLNYIQSSGTQYIDTGVSGGTNAEYSIKFDTFTTYAVTYEQFIAGDTSSLVPKIYRANADASNFCFQANSVTLTVTGNNFTVNYTKDGKTVINDTTYSELIASAGKGWGTLTWWIFGSHGETTLKSKMKLYSFIMWTNGSKVREFIPAKRNSDSVIGLYDKITKTFYTNAGTGSFTGG